MLGGQPGHGWQLFLPLWLHGGGSDFRLCDGSNLGTCLLVGMCVGGRLVLCCLWGPPGFACWVSLGVRFCLLLSPCPCLISLLYLDLYVLGDGALMG